MRATSLPALPVALSEGEEMPKEQVGPLTRTDFVRYAGAGGDLNPIHHDETFAVAAGMPSVFGMGMLHAGMLGTRLARWVGPHNIRDFAVRFTSQVWPGDTITFSGQVQAVRRSEGEAIAELTLSAARQTGEQVLKGTATVVVA